MQFLLFQIYAPLVSWGEIAVGEDRQSSQQPSKSAIIGLVSAALGIKREEEKRLNVLSEALGLGIKLCSSGSVLKDFHTVQVPRKENKIVYHTRQSELTTSSDKIGTILSRREYRCDAFAIVAIYIKKINSEFTLQSIERALYKPVFHLYFGRKSCVPALPLRPKIVPKNCLRDAFFEYQLEFPIPVREDEPDWLRKSFNQYRQKSLFDEKGISYFWEEGIDSGFNTLQIVERYDQPVSRKRWQFTYRHECMSLEKQEEAANVHE